MTIMQGFLHFLNNNYVCISRYDYNYVKKQYKSAKSSFKNNASLCINRPMRLFVENLKVIARFNAEIQLFLYPVTESTVSCNFYAIFVNIV